MIQSEASRSLERNPCCPAARPWILINVLLTCGEAIQPFSRFIRLRKLSSLAGPQSPSTPLENIIFGTNGKIVHSYLQEGGMPACILLFWDFTLGSHPSTFNLFSQSDYIKGVFMTTSVSMQQCHNSCSESLWRTPPSGQLREHSRELWVKTQKSACRLIDLLYLFFVGTRYTWGLIYGIGCLSLQHLTDVTGWLTTQYQLMMPIGTSLNLCTFVIEINALFTHSLLELKSI